MAESTGPVSSVTALVNGNTVTLTWDDASNSYKATLTAPSTSSWNVNSGHYYPVKVTATDKGGNEISADDQDATYGSTLRLRVIEKVAPTVTAIYPTQDANISNATPTIEWEIADDDSGIDQTTIRITVDDGTAASPTSVTAVEGKDKTYKCTYAVPAALTDGAHAFKMEVSDNDGNAATAVTVNFIVDTVPPALMISTPQDNSFTNGQTITVSGFTNDATSTSLTVTVNGTETPVGEDGTFTTTVTLAEGENTITIVSTDAAGKSTTVTRTVTLDTIPPVFQTITVSPNPVDAGQTYVITVTVTDA